MEYVFFILRLLQLWVAILKYLSKIFAFYAFFNQLFPAENLFLKSDQICPWNILRLLLLVSTPEQHSPDLYTPVLLIPLTRVPVLVAWVSDGS